MRRWLLAAAILLATGIANAGEPPAVSLHVDPTQASFAAGPFAFETGIVQFTAVFRNDSAQTISLCNQYFGNITVESVERDGQNIPPRFVRAFFPDGADDCDADDMVTLRKGQTLTMSISRLTSIQLGPDLKRKFGSAEPGQYVARFSYRYVGPDFGHAHVFRERVYSNPVRFTVVK